MGGNLRQQKEKAPGDDLPPPEENGGGETEVAEVRVEVQPDLLRADLTLRKSAAGTAPDEEAVLAAVKKSGVRGFDTEELRRTIRSFTEENAPVLRRLLAEGKAPTRGEDKEITLLFKPLPAEPRTALLKRLAALKTLPDSRRGFPFSEAEELCLVERGTPVARISRPANGEQGRDVYGALLPGLPGNDPELKLFRGLRQNGDLISAGAGGLLLIKAAARAPAGSPRPGFTVLWGAVIDYRDAAVTIRVSEDGMEARAELLAELGPGLPLTEDLVYRALAEAGVTWGINREAVETAVRLAALKGNAVQTLARGVPPAARGETEIRWNVSLKAESKTPVAAGTIIAVLREAAENRTGFDVRGKELAPVKGAETISWDDTIQASGNEGSKTLIAALGGEPFLEKGILSINSRKEIRGDVGNEEGDINFSGEIRITGRVCSGFSVVGGRDVFIGGSAEDAIISAGGKLVIVQGIRGGGHGVVRARTTIDTAFAEDAALLAVDDIRIVNRAVNCTIKTNGRVILPGQGGLLSGGVCRARRGISAGELGSPGQRTEISFGQDYLVKDQLEAAERELARIRSALGRNGTAEEEEQCALRIFTLREKYEEHHDSSVTVAGLVHPGVVIESHGRYYNITEQRRNTAFTFDGETGRIVERKP